MKTLSFRDVEQLSASLDGQLSQADRARLESRLESDPHLQSVLDELRQARALLRRTPQRRAPRNFTLTPKMARVRPPLPRLVPAFSWATAVAALLLFFTFAGNLITPLASAPKMAAPMGMGGGYGGGPDESTVPPSAPEAPILPTTTPERTTLMGSAPTTAAEDMRSMVPVNGPSVEQPRPAFSLSPLQITLIALVLMFGAAAFLVGWLTERTFRRKLRR